MKFLDLLDLHLEPASCAFQNVSSLRAVFGKEMKVISGDVDRANKLRRPETYERSLYVLESKFRLCSGCSLERHTTLCSSHCPRVDIAEHPVNAERVEDVL